MQVNLKAPFYLTQKLLPLLLRKPPSKVFTLVSRAGLSGLAGAANYAASKGGLIAMTKTLARELGRKKILVNAVNPGFMRSSITANVPQETLQRNLEESPLKTFSDPEEGADFLLFLSSDQMRQVTGQVFHFESRPF
jgi:3-oxoacyl-[acyl-carrier protein] reductase